MLDHTFKGARKKGGEERKQDKSCAEVRKILRFRIMQWVAGGNWAKLHTFSFPNPPVKRTLFS